MVAPVPLPPPQLPPLPRPSTNSARQPPLTQTVPLREPQLRPSVQVVPEICRDSRALRQPVLQTRSRLSWLSQRIVPLLPDPLPPPFQPPPLPLPLPLPLPRSEVAMSCLMREKLQPELTWAR